MNQFPTLGRGISKSSTKKVKYNTLQMNFGNGYSQTAPDGINNRIESWSLKWDGLTLTDRNALWAFFDQVGCFQAITWTPPGATAPLLFKIDISNGVQEQCLGGNVFTITCNISQVY